MLENKLTPGSEPKNGVIRGEYHQTAPEEAAGSAAFADEAAGPDRRTARRRFSRMGAAVLVILLVTTVLQVALATILNLTMAGGVQNTSWGLWVVTFAPQYLAAIPLGLLLLRSVPGERPERSSLGAGRYFVIILISIFMMYAGNLLGGAIQGVVEQIVGFVPENPLEEYIGGSSLILQVLCMVILAPLFEELVFRRTLIDRMRPYGEKLAVVTTAAMFALFHGNLSQMFYAFTLGLVFGYVYVRTGKLRYTVGLHMLINLLGGVVGPLLTDWAGDALDLEDVSRLAEAELTPGALALGAYGLLMIVAAIAGLVLLIVRAKRVRFQPAPLELPRGKRFSTAWLNPGMLLFTAACLLMVVSTFLTL